MVERLPVKEMVAGSNPAAGATFVIEFDAPVRKCYNVPMLKEFHVIIEKDKHGYFARCLNLAGCFAQGDTHEAVEREIVDAIQLHLKDIGNLEDELHEPESVSLSSIKVMVPV